MGHPLGREHDSTVPRGVEAPRQLKTEALHIDVVVLDAGVQRQSQSCVNYLGVVIMQACAESPGSKTLRDPGTGALDDSQL